MKTLTNNLGSRAYRMLTNPVVACAAVLAFAMVAGANRTVYNVVDTVVQRPLQIRDPEQLVTRWGNLVAENALGGPGYHGEVTDPNKQYEEWDDVAGCSSAEVAAGRAKEPVSTRPLLSVEDLEVRSIMVLGNYWCDMPRFVPQSYTVVPNSLRNNNLMKTCR